MRKTKSYTYFTEKEKGGVCWMIGEKPRNCQKGHDALFNMHRFLHLRHMISPWHSPVGIKQSALSWRRRGWNTNLRLTAYEPEFHLLSISVGAFRLFGKSNHYCVSYKDFHKHKYELCSANKQNRLSHPLFFFFFFLSNQWKQKEI